MKTVMITISLAVLFFAQIFFPQNVDAKEIIICYSGFFFSFDYNIEQSKIETWMSDSNYFNTSIKESSQKAQVIEEWMKDIQHFESPVATESVHLEKWMTNEKHFYRGLTGWLTSRNAHLDNHWNLENLVLARK